VAEDDPRRVAEAIREELAEVGKVGLGAVGGEPRDLNDILAARAISIDQAKAKGGLSFEEKLGP